MLVGLQADERIPRERQQGYGHHRTLAFVALKARCDRRSGSRGSHCERWRYPHEPIDRDLGGRTLLFATCASTTSVGSPCSATRAEFTVIAIRALDIEGGVHLRQTVCPSVASGVRIGASFTLSKRTFGRFTDQRKLPRWPPRPNQRCNELNRLNLVSLTSNLMISDVGSWRRAGAE